MKPITLFHVMRYIKNLEEVNFIITDKDDNKEYELCSIGRTHNPTNSIVLKIREKDKERD